MQKREFEDELKELVIKYKKDINVSESDAEFGFNNTQNLNPAVNILYEKFEQSIALFNKEFGTQVLFIEKLSVEIFKLLLNFEDINSCFFLRSLSKLVFVFNEGTDQITFFGRIKSAKKQNANPRFVQLFKLAVISANNKTEFKDNTGRNINIEEVVIQIIRWIVS